MEKTTFGKTGLTVSRLGFGGAPIGLLETGRTEVANILNLLLDEGVNLLDTAACYAGSEVAIGEAVGHRRDEYVIVSKCGHKVDGVQAAEWTGAIVTETVERALHRLKTDRIDVMLLHSCTMEVLEQGDVVAALLKARDAGKIRFAGYSGDNEEAAWAIANPELDVVEMSVNLCDQANIAAIPSGDRVGLIAKRPVANAAWRDDLPGFYSDYAQPYRDRFSHMKLSPADLGFEGDPADAWPEIALRFAFACTDVAIAGTTSPRNARANIAAARKGPLSPPAVETIREAFRAGQTAAGELWPGLT